MTTALNSIDTWPVDNAAAAVVTVDGIDDSRGDLDRAFELASITKLLTAYATLIAVEERSVSLDDAVGPPRSTVRHLLSHASGLPLDGPTPIARAGTRRIYSNTGFELLAGAVTDNTGVAFETYLGEAVLQPLAMAATQLVGSPASGALGTCRDLAAFARELLRPTLLAGETFTEATRVAFPGLAGVLPGFGPCHPNDWGLGFELRDHKSPHWTGRTNSPATFGHFGRSGGFVWVDPQLDCALVALTDRPFDDWAKAAWPALSEQVAQVRAPNL